MREKDGKRYLFALNYLAKEQRITLKQAAKALYTGETLQGEVALPPYGTAVLQIL